MRQALNNLQSTKEGFGLVKAENVFKVCDEPHPLLIKDMLQHCNKGSLDEAYKIMHQVSHSLWLLYNIKLNLLWFFSSCGNWATRQKTLSPMYSEFARR